MLVFGGLTLLTAIEVATAFVVRKALAGFEIGHESVTMLIIFILLGLALWKALLVALHFMHLKYETKALRWLAAAPLLPAAILVVVVLMEYV
jgi:caa(3)-type oxidase subunit IV